MYNFNIFSFSTLFVSEIYLLLGTYILARNTRAVANRLFFFVALTMAIWGLGESMMRASAGTENAIFWGNYIMGIGSAMHSAFLVHFWLIFSGQLAGFRKKIPIFIIYIPSIFFLSIRFFYPDLLITGVLNNYWGYSITGTRYYFLYMVFVASCEAIVAYLAFKKSLNSYGILRKQARNIGLGILFSFLLGVTTQLSRPILHMEIPEMTVVGTLIFISFIAHAVYKFGLLAITPGMAADDIIETMTDYLVVADQNRNIAFANDSALQLLGKKVGELSGKSLRELSIKLENIVKELDNKHLLKDQEIEMVNKHNVSVPVSMNISIMKDNWSNTIGYVIAMRDISYRKELMEKLSRSNQELEQFAYIASHDLNEPLRMVTSYLNLLVKRNMNKLDNDSKEFINFAIDGATRMQQLINDLLMYARVGTKGKPFVETNCKVVVETAIKNLEIAIREATAKITYDELPSIMADESQMVQLFQNLIGNALKFCKESNPEIHITAKQDNDKWVFGIRDNGIGIAPEFQDRVFQIFQRLHTGEEYKGTGIGLAICKKIVERHGGKIWIDSEIGKGSTFWFIICSPKTMAIAL